MRVEFHYFDSSQKRWFAKVARRAADRISEIAFGIDYELPVAWSAEFATDEIGAVTIRRSLDRHQTTISVTFAAGGWRSLDSCADDAASQMASAVLSTVPPDVASQLHTVFSSAGLMNVRHLALATEKVTHDPNYHIELCFHTASYEAADFHSVYDCLDAHLRKLELGFVDGSSSSRGGFCLDISLPQLEPGISSIVDFAAEYVQYHPFTLTDCVTGRPIVRESEP